MNDLTVTKPQSLVTRIADRYGVEPGKMLATLTATAFRTDKGVSNEQLLMLLAVAERYRLDPFTKELFAFPDKGGIVPVVSVDGWARIINEHPQFDGMDFELAADGSSCTCTIYRKDRQYPVKITEYLSECKRGSPPWQSHPRRMLRHKALIQCARMAFGFAGIYDQDEAERIIAGPSVSIAEPPSNSAERVRQVLAPVKTPLSSDEKPLIENSSQSVIFTLDSGQVPDPEADPTTSHHSADATAEAGLALVETYAQRIRDSLSADEAGEFLDEARTSLGKGEYSQLVKQYRQQWAIKE